MADRDGGGLLKPGVVDIGARAPRAADNFIVLAGTEDGGQFETHRVKTRCKSHRAVVVQPWWGRGGWSSARRRVYRASYCLAHGAVLLILRSRRAAAALMLSRPAALSRRGRRRSHGEPRHLGEKSLDLGGRDQSSASVLAGFKFAGANELVTASAAGTTGPPKFSKGVDALRDIDGGR